MSRLASCRTCGPAERRGLRRHGARGSGAGAGGGARGEAAGEYVEGVGDFFQLLGGAVAEDGGEVGAAAVGALLQGRLAARLGAGQTYPAAFTAALHTTAVLPLAVLAAGALVCLPLRRRSAAAVPARARRSVAGH
ncbi:hypothetical protein [Streptomyces sp. NPDC058086]|uniref:hypothetical protein n=1 Tax=Streptomyces sp. NPDC058086 TaxID=3346334 RepID=UPI0036E59FF8